MNGVSLIPACCWPAKPPADQRFTDYAGRRLKFIADLVPMFRAQVEARAAAPAPAAPGAPAEAGGGFRNQVPLRNVIAPPRSLDDSGSLCAAMLKAHQAGVGGDLRPIIDNYMKFISTGQFRFADGTLARNRPLRMRSGSTTST